ncbi:MAG: FG-GAP repeat protein [Caldilineaceae bacterium]
MVGDVNGDGVPDQVAAAPGAGENRLGEAYLFSGVDGAILYTLTLLQKQAAAPLASFCLERRRCQRRQLPDIFVGDYAAMRDTAPGTGRAYIYSGVDGTPLHIFEAEHDGDGLGPGRHPRHQRRRSCRCKPGRLAIQCGSAQWRQGHHSFRARWHSASHHHRVAIEQDAHRGSMR